MRTLTGIGLVVLAATPAAADTIAGRVTAAQGRFTDGGLHIVTDVTVRTTDGRNVTVVARGGRAGGLGQLEFPSPPIPQVGDEVEVVATAGQVVDLTVTSPGAVPFVRTGPTGGGHYLYWTSGCVFMTYDADGTVDIAGDGEFAAMDAALADWNDSTSSCSYMTLMSLGTSEEPDPVKKVGNDHVNRILYRDDRWVRPTSSGETMLPSGAAALTTVTFVDEPSSSRDGEIVDTDVEMNGEQFAFSINGTTAGPQTLCKADIESTLTHELGHVQGLSHTCLTAGDPPATDGDGHPVPLCSATTDPVIVEATMYPFQDCGETKKSSPEQDDIDAICTVYPRDQDPGTCAPVGEDKPGCCSTGRGEAPGAVLLALVTFATAAGRRRR